MNVLDIYSEAKDIFASQNKSEIEVSVKLRNLVEVTSKGLAESLGICTKSMSLGECIKELEQTGALPQEICRAMQYIRVASNEKIHGVNDDAKIDELLSKAWVVASYFSRFEGTEFNKNPEILISSQLDPNKWIGLLKVTVKLNSEYIKGFDEWTGLTNLNDLISVGIVNDEIINTYLSLECLLNEILFEFNPNFRVSLNEARSGSIEIDTIIHIYNSNKDIIDFLTSVKDWGGWLVSLGLMIKMQVSKRLNKSNLSNVTVTIDEESLYKIKEIVRDRTD